MLSGLPHSPFTVVVFIPSSFIHRYLSISRSLFLLLSRSLSLSLRDPLTHSLDLTDLPFPVRRRGAEFTRKKKSKKQVFEQNKRRCLSVDSRKLKCTIDSDHIGRVRGYWESKRAKQADNRTSIMQSKRTDLIS